MSTTGYSASPCRKLQKQSDRLLCKSECDRTSHIPKSDRLTENLKNNA
ncbi:MAG: hypothetical protein RMX97_17315 [Nostoc sp. DedQUE11]|nr:hypothetical protein [Nostoc sp. DedQUE11]